MIFFFFFFFSFTFLKKKKKKKEIETLPPMAGHSIVYDPIRDVLYLFGGKNFDKSTSNFYLYDFGKKKKQIIFLKI